MSKYELNNDLRKYMGLDEPNEVPVARLERATGGMCYANGGHKKKDKNNMIGAIAGGAGALAAALGGKYIYDRISPAQQQNTVPNPRRFPNQSREARQRIDEARDDLYRPELPADIKANLAAYKEKMRAKLAQNAQFHNGKPINTKNNIDQSIITRESPVRKRLGADEHYEQLQNTYRNTETPEYQNYLRSGANNFGDAQNPLQIKMARNNQIKQ